MPRIAASLLPCTTRRAADARELTELLLANGADVNAKDRGQGTPLHAAASEGHKEVAKLLLASNAQVNAKDDYNGATPLHYAAARGHTEVAELLVASGADVKAKDKNGSVPLQLTSHDTAADDIVEKVQAMLKAHPPTMLNLGDHDHAASRKTTGAESDYWKCPRCGSVLQKGIGAILGAVVGTATCGKCGAAFPQSEVYGGKFDIGRKYGPTAALPVFYQVLKNRAFWGNGHEVAFP